MLFRPINLGIVDDHSLFRKTLKVFLSEQPDINVVVQAENMVDLLSKLKHTPIDLLVMDIFMPGPSGEEGLKLFRQAYPNVKVLILSMSRDLALIGDLLESGIHAFVSKSDEPEELLKAIHTVADNKIYRNKILTDALYLNNQNNLNIHPSETRVVLNDREKRILQLIWEEKSNKEIADELFVGVRSVEKIRQDMKEKLGVRSTVGLLKYAIDRRIIGTSLIANT